MPRPAINVPSTGYRHKVGPGNRFSGTPGGASLPSRIRFELGLEGIPPEWEPLNEAYRGNEQPLFDRVWAYVTGGWDAAEAPDLPPHPFAEYVRRAFRYARAVYRGERTVNRFTRLAVERFLRDYARVDWRWTLDWWKAGRPCYFIERLSHVKGHWAAAREKIHLEDWQCFFIVGGYGFVDSETLRRKHTVHGLFVARKNAKSTLASGLALYMLRFDGEEGAEVYCGATTEKQAKLVFEPAKAMVRREPVLEAYFGYQLMASNICVPETISKFEPVIHKPGDGASPSFAVVDEYHEHDTDVQVDTFITGMGARLEPVLLVITTAGDNIQGPCYSFQKKLEAHLEGRLEDDRLWGTVYAAEEGDEWDSDEALERANPNLGISVMREFLHQQREEARRDPRKLNTFKRKHLDVWVNAGSPWVNIEAWNAAADPALDPADFAGEYCEVGVDLAAKNDLSGTVRAFRRYIDGEEHYYVFPRAYLPEATVHLPENSHYQGWANAGHLTVTPGAIVDLDAVAADIITAHGDTPARSVRFDPYNAPKLAKPLMDEGLLCVEVPQSVKYLSDPMKWIQALIDAGRLHHPGNPILDWCMANVEVKPDFNENIFPRKGSDKAKIDLAVALILAVGALIADAEAPEESVYEARGLVTVG